MTILQAGEIAEPVFSGGDMAYVSATLEQIARWVGFSSMARSPEMFEDMRRDREKSVHVTKRILARVVGRAERPGLKDRRSRK